MRATYIDIYPTVGKLNHSLRSYSMTGKLLLCYKEIKDLGLWLGLQSDLHKLYLNRIFSVLRFIVDYKWNYNYGRY